MAVFLIQSSDGSHDGCVYENPGVSTAEEVINHGYYYFPCWEAPGYQGREFANIHVGDKVIHYCAGKVKQSPSMIRYIYEVTAVENVPEAKCQEAISSGRCDPDWVRMERSLPRILRLKRVYTLRSPMIYKEIRALVESHGLSGRMKNCGRLGFNLCEVSGSDLSYMLGR